MPKKIDRIVVCQAFLDALGGGSYLEIGVNRGRSFIPIRAQVKWGVDPAHLIPRYRLLNRRLITAWLGKEEPLFRMTSDDFFQRQSGLLALYGVDVALIDGLHTYPQTLRDVLNTLEYLKPGGAIVLHDCNPASEVIATPAESIKAAAEKCLPGWTGEWTGDVWKVIVHLRALRADLEAVVLDCDYGVGVVRRKSTSKTLQLSANEIEQMQYADLNLNRQELLGLKSPTFLWEMVEAARRENDRAR